MPGLLRGVYAHSSGGGKFLAILQIGKRSPADEGRQRQAALTALAAFPELKHVILVDEDVNIYDSNDVPLGHDRSLPGRTPTRSSSPASAAQPSILRATRTAPPAKTIFDCTVPFHQKGPFPPRGVPGSGSGEMRLGASGSVLNGLL